MQSTLGTSVQQGITSQVCIAVYFGNPADNLRKVCLLQFPKKLDPGYNYQLSWNHFDMNHRKNLYATQ